MEFKKWILREEMRHTPQSPQHQSYDFEFPSSSVQPVGTTLRDPDKPEKVRRLEELKAKKQGKIYRKPKDPIEKMFTGE